MFFCDYNAVVNRIKIQSRSIENLFNLLYDDSVYRNIDLYKYGGFANLHLVNIS